MLLIGIVTALPFAFVCILLFMLPHLSRRTQFFAVTVAPDFRDSAEARAILRRYRFQVAIHCAIGVAIFALVIAFNAVAWLELAFLWPVVGALIAVAVAHHHSLRYAVPAGGIRQATLRPRPVSFPGGPYLSAGPLAILAIAGFYVSLRWNEIPDRFPIHWDSDYQPNGWGTRSVSGVFMPMWLGLSICLMMMFFNWQVARNSRGSSAMRKLTIRVLMVFAYFMAGLFGWLTVALPLGRGAPSPASVGVIMGGLAVLIAAMVFYGIRAKAEPEPAEGAATAAPSTLALSDNTADRNWVGGLFYFNPDDPAIFVEKRIGIGYDINFGNPRSWAFLGVILVMPVVAVLLTTLK